MSIEEKAKAYDEASKWMEGIYPTLTHEQQGEAEAFFPMFKESEDERIKRAIIEHLRDNYLTEWASWLEKQGQKDPCEDCKHPMLNCHNFPCSKKQKYQGKSALEAVKEEKVDNANKVERKFKVGDFIVNDYCKGKVIELTTDAYLLDTEQGIPFSCEHNAHLWNIQDANDGDVLARNNDILSICIFSHFDGINNKFSSFLCHCGIEGEGLGQELSINGYHDDSKNYIPATKEQCDILFQKMHEVGYEWDSEKKELRKVKQPKLTEFEDAVKDMMNDYRDAIDEHLATVEEIKEQAAYLLSLIPQNPV